MGATQECHLQLIAEIADVLGKRDVPFWLRGGWALDFLLGEVTRTHQDIDLVSRLRDRESVRAGLEANGFALAREEPEVALEFTKHETSVHVLLVERLATGEVVVRGHEYWPLAEGALDGPAFRLHEITCRVLSAAALLEEKEGYLLHRGRPPRVKDLLSIDLLRTLTSRTRSRIDEKDALPE